MSGTSAEEFYVAYCERSGCSTEWLSTSGQRAYSCDCREEGCEGWAMLGGQDVAERRSLTGRSPLGLSDDDLGYAPSSDEPLDAE